MAQGAITYRNVEDDPDSLEVVVDGSVLGTVMLAEDECCWYCIYIQVEDGKWSHGELRKTRRLAAEDLIQLCMDEKLGNWHG